MTDSGVLEFPEEAMEDEALEAAVQTMSLGRLKPRDGSQRRFPGFLSPQIGERVLHIYESCGFQPTATYGVRPFWKGNVAPN